MSRFDLHTERFEGAVRGVISGSPDGYGPNVKLFAVDCDGYVLGGLVDLGSRRGRLERVSTVTAAVITGAKKQLD